MARTEGMTAVTSRTEFESESPLPTLPKRNKDIEIKEPYLSLLTNNKQMCAPLHV